jgi:sialate O-acetylesterase
MKYCMKRLGVVCVAMACSGTVRAEVQPHALFTDGVVFQRGVSVPVWGKAKQGEEVVVEICGQKATAVADLNCNWRVRLEKLEAGGPFTMIIRGENIISLTNVCVGEVWVCSGQSNMELPLMEAETADHAIPAAHDPLLRLFHTPMCASESPQYNVSTAWQICLPTNVSSFSAVGYFFGRDLRRQLKIPIGLIESDWGGTYAEAWTDRNTLESNPVLCAAFDRFTQAVKHFDPDRARVNYERALLRFNAAVAQAKAAGQPPPRYAPRVQQNPRDAPNRPAVLFNGMIAPLQPFPIRGVIWYQGEANYEHPKEYQTLFPALIGCWRKTWGCGDFPFLFVQIAPYHLLPPELREAQLVAWHRTTNTAMVVITDHGEATDIHPRAKEPVGQRLALAARAIAYGENIEYSGPLFTKIHIEDHAAVLTFDHIGDGLMAKDGVLKGFMIAGSDKKFVPAEAMIDGDTVVVSSAAVRDPVGVRYGWANVPDSNLFNKEGLPATPFRTNEDDVDQGFPGIVKAFASLFSSRRDSPNAQR